MAYNESDRFPPYPIPYKMLDPGAYQNNLAPTLRESKAPFNSLVPRQTQPGNKSYTDAIYDTKISHKIPNCTSLMSKIPRFPYEAFSKEDLKEILCRCGLDEPCECPVDDVPKPEVVCQGKVPRTLFIGPPPRSIMGSGLSAPSKKDKGFQVTPDGKKVRIREEPSDEGPPFYDARVYESTAFYQGCKWSQWTSTRATRRQEQWPGPADYDIENKITAAQRCEEEYRSYKRKTSKQMRFIEMVQHRDIIEGRPGPGLYSPEEPKGTQMSYLGPKEERFPERKFEVQPGPADYQVKRAFDTPEPPEKYSRARLPEPPFFGVKAARFKPRLEEGASPASYDVKFNPCHVTNCSKAPFGVSALRWKRELNEDTEDISDDEDESDKENNEEDETNVCPDYSWMFKSTEVRLKPLVKKLNEPSPADMAQNSYGNLKRPGLLQYLAPFNTSEGRFQPWNDWLPVYGKEKTPGVCVYNAEKPKCPPAVYHGPLFRAPRFAFVPSQSPAPNEYDVGGGIETVLKTHNTKLQEKINSKHKFHWTTPTETKKMSFPERENLLLNQCINLLDVPDIFAFNSGSKPTIKKIKKDKIEETDKSEKPKLLRCFLYNKQIPNSI